jgi:hypothetical protein
MSTEENHDKSESASRDLKGFALLVQDVKRLWSLAAKVGAILAIVCHLLPPHYRVPCNAIASFCRGIGGH